MKQFLSWPAPLIRKWLLSLLLCLPFLIAAIVSAFSGDRTFLMLSALLLLFCSIRCAELYALLKNERYHAEEGVCLTVSRIPFSRQRSVTLQKVDGSTVVFCAERNVRLTVGQTYRVYFPTHAVVGEFGNVCLPRPCALAVERIEVSASADTEPSSRPVLS